jgi:hypothetical protein
MSGRRGAVQAATRMPAMPKAPGPARWCHAAGEVGDIVARGCGSGAYGAEQIAGRETVAS